MSGTHAHLRLTGHGFAVLPAFVDLQPTASGTWVDTGLVVDLPAAGTWQLDATVRTAMTAQSPMNVFTIARLFDSAGAAAVPDSEVIVQQINIGSPGNVVNEGGNCSAPIQVLCTVPGPRSIHLQAARINSVGATTNARVISDGHGRTTLRYTRVA